MMNDKSIKTALVTGGTRGIGKAIAEKLCDDGHDVIVTGTSKSNDCSENITYRQVNFLDDKSFLSFERFIEKEHIDILVNNAGINKIGEISEIPLEEFDDVVKVNLRAPFRLTQLVIPKMKKENWGRIVNISSVFGKISKEHRAPYSATKFGIDGMTVAISAEVSRYGILVNSVAPGFIETDMTRTILGESGISEMKAKVPMARLGSPEEVSKLVSWLVSEENTYVTSQNIAIDGGFTRV